MDKKFVIYVFLILIACAIVSCKSTSKCNKTSEDYDDKTIILSEKDFDYQKIDKNLSQKDSSYILGPGDQIEVLLERYSFNEQDYTFELTSDFIERFAGLTFTRYKTSVDPNYNVNIPLIGEIKSNCSAGVLKDIVESKLDQYIKNPKVFIKIVSYSSYHIMVLGEVKQPGTFNLARPLTVSEAIALAGGVTDDGSLKKVYVIRKGQKMEKINVKEIWAQGYLTQDFILRRGDIVYVPLRFLPSWRKFNDIATAIEAVTNTYWLWDRPPRGS